MKLLEYFATWHIIIDNVLVHKAAEPHKVHIQYIWQHFLKFVYVCDFVVLVLLNLDQCFYISFKVIFVAFDIENAYSCLIFDYVLKRGRKYSSDFQHVSFAICEIRVSALKIHTNPVSKFSSCAWSSVDLEFVYSNKLLAYSWLFCFFLLVLIWFKCNEMSVACCYHMLPGNNRLWQ